MTDLEYLEHLLDEGELIPVDLTARLLEQGYDVDELIDLHQ